MRYSENHHLNSDDGGTNVHVALHLQGASLLRAMEFVDAVLATAGEFVLEAETPISPPDLTVSPGVTVLRPQTSGYCVHIDQADDKDPEEIQALGLACRHPGRISSREDECPQEWECPHLNCPDVLCSVRDACYAMAEVARLRDACDDVDMMVANGGRLHTYTVAPEPEFPDPAPEEPVYQTRKGAPLANMWAPAECAAIAGAGTRQEAIAGYRAAFPDSDRTDGAVMRQWYAVRSAPVTATDDRRGTWTPEEEAILLASKNLAAAVKTYRAKFGDKRTYAALSSRFYRIRKNQVKPTPDFSGDEVPVTQCEELDPDEVDPDQVVSREAPFATGDQVVVRSGPDVTDVAGLEVVGEVVMVRNGHASVQFPGPGPARVYPLADLRRVAS